jgi:biofilm PGA synthesis N-glycosyltransferase PgaC
MFRDIFFYTLVACNLINILHLGFFIVGANVYDIRTFKKQKLSRKPIEGFKRKPLVSIVIAAHNEATGIKRTLDSVRASSYQKIEIIVIDDGSTDNTANVVRSYIKKLPAFKIESYITRNYRTQELRRRYIRAEIDRMRILVISQRNLGKAAALNNAIGNYVRGKYMMCLDADSMLDKYAIERAVKYFDSDPRVVGVAANVRIVATKGLIGTLQRFEHMIGYRSKKFYTLTNSEFIVGGVGSTYVTKVLRQVGLYDTDTVTEDIGLSLKIVASKGNRDFRIVYASDVVAMTEGVQTFKALLRQRYRWKMGSLQNLIKYRYLLGNEDSIKYGKMLTLYRLPMAFLGEFLLMVEPLTLGYVVYLSITLHTYALLLGAYITITLYVLWTLWPDEHLTNQQKIKMSFQALGIYMLFYSMDFVQITAIFRCLFQYKAITKRNIKQSWTSPARSTVPVQA